MCLIQHARLLSAHCQYDARAERQPAAGAHRGLPELASQLRERQVFMAQHVLLLRQRLMQAPRQLSLIARLGQAPLRKLLLQLPLRL